MIELPDKCGYNCGTLLVDWNNKERKFVEKGGKLHTKERCLAIQKGQDPDKVEKIDSYSSPKGGLKDTPEIKDAKKTVMLRLLKEFNDKISAMIEAY